MRLLRLILPPMMQIVFSTLIAWEVAKGQNELAILAALGCIYWQGESRQ